MRAPKEKSEWLEIPIFIHGITPEETPPDHVADYDSLRERVNKHLKLAGKPPLSYSPIYVEWGRRFPVVWLGSLCCDTCCCKSADAH